MKLDHRNNQDALHAAHHARDVLSVSFHSQFDASELEELNIRLEPLGCQIRYCLGRKVPGSGVLIHSGSN